jgi:hypothetical protein
MSSDKLQSFLVSAVTRHLCTRIYCTTCGALEFRKGVVHAATGNVCDPRQLDRETIHIVAKALVGIRRVEGLDIDAAIRCALFDLWAGIPIFDAELEEILKESYVGGILQQMKVHYASVQLARAAAAEFQSPDATRLRREAKRQHKQEQHLQRLEQKRERDEIWRLRNQSLTALPQDKAEFR